MTQTLRFTAETADVRMDRYLDSVCPDLSRSRLQQLITQGNVTLDNKATTKAATKLKVGQLIVVTVPEPVESLLKPQNIPLDVVYQDSDVIVVDKPAGLTVHPGPGHPDGTLVNALLALCPDLQGIGGTVRPGIVHRLDKDTSGLMMVAKNEVAHRKLSDAMKAGECKKVYIALVHGNVSLDEAAIDAPIGRDPANRKRMAIVSTGREATTRYRVTQLPPGSEQYEYEGKIYAGYKESPDKWDKGTEPVPIGWYAGMQYDGDVARAKKVLDELNKYYPDTKRYEIAGFFWWQGDKDRYNAAHASKYEENLVRLIQQLRKDFDAPKANFVIATLGQTKKGSTGNEGMILDAMFGVDGKSGKYPEFKGNVATVYTHPLSQGGASNSHYNGNAQTYMDVGLAMGEAMVQLIKLKK